MKREHIIKGQKALGLLTLCLCVSVLFSQQIFAQEAIVAEPGQPKSLFQEEINPTEIPSLLFTFWEYTAIQDARKSRGSVRPPTQEELQDSLDRGEPKVKPPPKDREIFLSGISYIAQNEWTIWLNGKRVTPKAVPREVIDLQVYENYIEVKWFDEYTNQVLPIRLRPHQRFNMDTRIFLPGVFK